MINLLLFIIFILLLIFLILINFFLSKKIFKNREKSSPFECGFDCISSNRLPFSLQFYLIRIIFLIFDVEISLILPIVLSMRILKGFVLINCIIIILILLLGLYLEWYEGALKWFK